MSDGGVSDIATNYRAHLSVASGGVTYCALDVQVLKFNSL